MPHTCANCHVVVEPAFTEIGLPTNGDYARIFVAVCPSCREYTIKLQKGATAIGRPEVAWKDKREIFPPQQPRKAPNEVPNPLAADYVEAASVQHISPKASAAISRRCLQHILREHAGVKKQDLANEIQEVLDSGKLPSYLAAAVDGVRNIGNFSAHPIKSQYSGSVVDVEPGEAEWCLDTLEGLFDFYFVQPAILQRKRDELNKKLADAGKPPMK